MFCSTVIPTIGRDTLARAVNSVLDQEFSAAAFEVIVVNDSGKPLRAEPWQSSERVTVLTTQRRERSVARNAGAAIARGRFLHFLDDDDVLLPGALAAFWQLSQTTGAIWLYGAYETVDNDGNRVNAFAPELAGNVFAWLVAGESIPLQASLVRADRVRAVGGFDPELVGVEDRDLGRRLALDGEVAGMSASVARIRVGRLGSTTDWSRIAELDRQGREKALREPGALERARDSARSSYLRGRVCRAYLASAGWNARRGGLLVAARRVMCAAIALVPARTQPGLSRGLRVANQ